MSYLLIYGRPGDPDRKRIKDIGIGIIYLIMDVPDNTERPYIWLMVDVTDIGPCWPKKPHIKANSRFTISVHEEGPKKEFTVCMYAVGEGYHETFKRWVEDQKFGGIPIIPAQYKLDEATYRLEGM